MLLNIAVGILAIKLNSILEVSAGSIKKWVLARSTGGQILLQHHCTVLKRVVVLLYLGCRALSRLEAQYLELSLQMSLVWNQGQAPVPRLHQSPRRPRPNPAQPTNGLGFGPSSIAHSGPWTESFGP